MSAKMSWWKIAVVVCVLLTSNVADAKPIVVVEEILTSEEDEFPPVYVDTAANDEAASEARKALLDRPQAQGIDNTIHSPGPNRPWDPNTIGGQNSWDFNQLNGGFDGNELYPSEFEDDDDDIFRPLPVETTPPPPPPPPARPQLSLLTLAEKIKKLERRMSARRADISRQVDKESRRRKELELVIRRQGKLIRELRVKNKFLRDMVGDQEEILEDLREDEDEEPGAVVRDPAPSPRFNRAAWSRN
ncbi:uncharacterized protein [Branchiostoma lanceolatum]|uniref:uncharacterized protein n=1 Tax=Branchiostoma lanceolatum TaxID=7740 RepID=UPI00345400D6